MKQIQWLISLRAKFITFFCLLISVPFLISGIITYREYTNNVEMDAKAYTLQIIDQITMNLDRYIRDMERLTLNPYYDDNVLNTLRSHDNPYPNQSYVINDEIMKMNLYISSLAIDRSELQAILIYANDGSLFSNLEDGSRKRWDESIYEWANLVKRMNGDLAIIPPHEAAYYPDQPRKVISIARLIKEPYSLKNIGMIKVDLTSKGIEKMLSGVSFSSNSKLYIFDREGQLLYPDGGSFAQPIMQDIVKLSGQLYLSASKQSDYTGLNVVALIPQQDLRQGAKALTQFTLMISVLSLLAAYIFAVLLSNRLVKPIRYLQGKMKRVQMGYFSERAVVPTHDEIGQLTRGFNVMVAEIDRLVKEVYEIKIREREAELSALHSQINPHFLYNTLESINMLAVEKQHSELSNIVVNLGKLLRYTLDKKEKLVYLRNELAFIDAYLQIQASRANDLLTAEIHVDLSHEYGLVPKLILQPLIENIIEHAVGSALVIVKLYTVLVEDDLYIYIQDDGIGISKERQELIEKRMHSNDDELTVKQSFDEKKKGFALRNVHQRIRLHYGDPYGLFIDKTVQNGTRFFLRIPFQWEA